MKIDVISIFPEYLSPLKLSLLGKAQSAGLLEIEVHDLRALSTDNHNTVDDTPYGGGAGMVMLPEVWGKTLDPLMSENTDLIILTPAGRRFTQKIAEEFSTAAHLYSHADAMKELMIGCVSITRHRNLRIAIFACMKSLSVITF